MIIVVTAVGSIRVREGQPKPDIPHRIISLTINGEALQNLKEFFTNIPINTLRNEMVYKGELARVIYDNI